MIYNYKLTDAKEIFLNKWQGSEVLCLLYDTLKSDTAPIMAKYCFSDLAFKKKTEQSSTAYNGFSSRAVDENYAIHYDRKSCTHTNKEMNPWWRVDLGREYIVTGT